MSCTYQLFEARCTDRLVCYAAWFLNGQFARCWSSWCQTPHPPRASTLAGERHRACGTDEDAYPAGTPGLPQFFYTSHSWRTGKHKWDNSSHLKVFRCCASVYFETRVTDDERQTRELHCYSLKTKPQMNHKSLRMASALKAASPVWILTSTSSFVKCINQSFLPVGMATLLEREGKLVFPAVPGFLRSHLKRGNIHQNKINKGLITAWLNNLNHSYQPSTHTSTTKNLSQCQQNLIILLGCTA